MKKNPKVKEKFYLPIVFLLIIPVTIFAISQIYPKILLKDSTKKVEDQTQITINIGNGESQDEDKNYYLGLAKKDLANKLDIDKKKIEVINITPHNFSDTSLGCPQRNQMYAQVITPGFIMILKADSTKYIYNAGSKRVVTCRSS